MSLNFLSPRVELLGGDGRLSEMQPAVGLGRFRPSVILLARELCTFQHFGARSLGRRELMRAARLHADGASPYGRAAHVLVPSHDGVSIWWWDADRVAALLAGAGRPAAARVRPETLAQPAGDGLRLVKLASGYEAQRWVQQKLVASAWRSRRFDDAGWLQFARGAGATTDEATAPPAASLAFNLNRPGLAPSLADLDRRQLALIGGAGAAMAVAGFICLSLGQAWRLNRDAAEIEARAEALSAEVVSDGDVPRRRLLAEAEAFEAAASATSPLSAAGVIVGITALHDLAPTRLTIEGEEAELVLPYAAIEKVNELTPEFEASGYFEDVRPQANRDAMELTYTMRVRQGLPPLSAGG